MKEADEAQVIDVCKQMKVDGKADLRSIVSFTKHCHKSIQSALLKLKKEGEEDNPYGALEFPGLKNIANRYSITDYGEEESTENSGEEHVRKKTVKERKEAAEQTHIENQGKEHRSMQGAFGPDGGPPTEKKNFPKNSKN